jgi:predicted DNA-binding WGR domain protein
MAPRALYFTDPALQPLASAVCDVLADVHKLRTKAALLPAKVDGKLLSKGVVLKVHPGGTFAPKAKTAALKFDLIVPGGILPQDLKIKWPMRVHDEATGSWPTVSHYETLVRVLASTLAPYVDAPAKRTIAMYTRKADKQKVNAVIELLRAAGLAPLPPKEAVVDGEYVFTAEETKWRKTAWARLELDFIQGNECKVCVRGESTRGVEIGNVNHLYKLAYKVRNPSGESPAKTRQRLHDLLDKELVPKLGGVPVKHKRTEATTLLFLGGGSAPTPTKAKAATKTPAPKAAKATPAKAAAGARRFEFQAGGSSKFWTVSTKGSTVSVTFGRIGTAGQSKDKSYASKAAALAAMQTLVDEKTGKGYVEV